MSRIARSATTHRFLGNRACLRGFHVKQIAINAKNVLDKDVAK